MILDEECAAIAETVRARAWERLEPHAAEIDAAQRDLPVERLYREAKFYEVAQGSLELQLVIVAKDVLRSYLPDTHSRWRPGE